MREMTVRIRKPDDSNDWWTTTIGSSSDSTFRRSQYDIHLDRSKNKDMVHGAIKAWWKTNFGRGREYHKGFSRHMSYPVTLWLSGCPFIINKKTKYSLNGSAFSLDQLSDILARLTFKSCFETNPEAMMKYYFTVVDLPEDVRYVLENRAPFHFYSDFTKHEVRLNVQRIGDKELAVELSDGVWGNMSINEMKKFCGFYLHGKKSSSWKFTSPRLLYTKLIGREPSNAELKLMIAFLMQNRTQDIVEKRAQELVTSLLKQYSDRMVGEYYDDGTIQTMYIRGKAYDWRLTCNGASSGTQQVNTWVWQPTAERVTDDDGNKVTVYGGGHWSGSICIDNMQNNSSKGDQFAARAMALLNDTMTVTRVSTIRRYLIKEDYRNEKLFNKNKSDDNEM